jgi:hypothetical protein
MSNEEVSKFSDLSYFDNLALYYVCNETPPKTLALAFLEGDAKVVGSMLGLLEPKRREFIHSLMSQYKDTNEQERQSALSGILIIANGLITRNLIQKQGRYYYGTKKK